MEILDESLRRKLIRNRGQLYAYPEFEANRAAVVLIDYTAGFMNALRGSGSLIKAVNALTKTAHGASIPIYWVSPAPINHWQTRDNALSLLGEKAGQEDPEAMKLATEFTRYEDDHYLPKTGYSAFYPGTCDLARQLTEAGRDTVILGGVLTDICVTSSARDAFEAGFRVLIAEDMCEAADPELHQGALRTLARSFADINSAEGFIALIEQSD